MKILNLSSLLSLQSGSLLAKYADEEFLTISPMIDEKLESSEFIKCEIGSLNYVLALLASKFSSDAYFDSLDSGFLSGECNVGEEEIDEIAEFMEDCEVVIIDDMYLNSHNDAKNISSFLRILQDKIGFKLLNLKGEEIDIEETKPQNLADLELYDGVVIFKHTKNRVFKGGKYFSMIAKIKDGDEVNIKTKTLNLRAKFALDENLKGTIALLGVDKIDGYNYEIAEISKV